MTSLIGRTTVAVTHLPDAVLGREGWENEPVICLLLDDGTLIYPSRDEEGNGPGVLFGYGPSKQPGFHLWSRIETEEELHVPSKLPCHQ